MYIISKKIILLLIVLLCLTVLSAKDITGKEYIKSLILPGFGEITSQHNSGYLSIATEALIWSSAWYLSNERKLKDKQSYLKAVESAHINKDVNMSENYAEKLKRYMSSGFEPGGYNEDVLHNAILLYPDNKEKQDEYIKENMIPDDLAWEWDTSDDKHSFAIMRKRMLQYSNYLKVTTGMMLVNRLISLINLTRIKKSMELQVGMNDNYDTVISLKYKF